MKKIPVTKRALIQRINRRLRDENQMVKKYRGGRWHTDLGDYYLLDFHRNTILAGHLDLEERGRELGALAAFEKLG